jgi:hypothetical protein
MTGDEIPSFPATVGHIQTLDCKYPYPLFRMFFTNVLHHEASEANRILAALDQPVDGPIEARRSRILVAVGINLLAITPELMSEE